MLPTSRAMIQVVDALLRPVVASTNWAVLLSPFIAPENVRGRETLHSLVFLLTRSLLPNQIAQNRALLALLYERRKHLAIRFKLRYDMLCEWGVDGVVGVASVPPALVAEDQQENGHSVLQDTGIVTEGLEETELEHATQEGEKQERCLMPNIWSTHIAAPATGYSTHGVRERMKHHVTNLDAWLLLTDSQICAWSAQMLLGESPSHTPHTLLLLPLSTPPV